MYENLPTQLVDNRMKDLFKIFDEHIETINKLVEEPNFLGCETIATDLITISVMSDFGDGILIGEVLEAVFSQISPLFVRFEISEKEQNAIKNKVKEQITLIGKSYNKEDKRNLYEALKNLRSLVTEFQFKCWKTIKRKKEAEGILGIRRRLRRE